MGRGGLIGWNRHRHAQGPASGFYGEFHVDRVEVDVFGRATKKVKRDTAQEADLDAYTEGVICYVEHTLYNNRWNVHPRGTGGDGWAFRLIAPSSQSLAP